MTFTPTAVASYRVRLTVTDQDGGARTVEALVSAGAFAPAARLRRSGAAVEGREFGLVFRDLPADRSDLRFSFDFNNDGDFVDAGDVLDSPDAAARHLFRDSGRHTVRGRIGLRGGSAFTDFLTDVVVKNAAPTLTLADADAQDPRRRGQAEGGHVHPVGGRPVAVGPCREIHLPHRLDRREGRADQTLVGKAKLTVKRAFAKAGKVKVKAWVKDREGATSAAKVLTITVR